MRPNQFLRLVVLDYPKLLLGQSQAYSIFGDLVRCRQKLFLDTSDSFLVIDKHDLIGTHFLTYDLSNPFKPTLIAGFRITYQDRAQAHGLTMPIESALPCCPPEATSQYQEFCREKGNMIQFNTLFIDPQYTFSKSQLKLSDMLFFAVCAFIRRLGFNHYVGATNDRLKTDRWMKRAGEYSRPTFSFSHPDVQDPHTLFFIDALNNAWLLDCFDEYRHFWNLAYEIIPDRIKTKSFAQVREEIVNAQPIRKAS